MRFSNVRVRNNIFYKSVDYCLYSEEEYSGSNTGEMWAAFDLDYNCYYQASTGSRMIRWRGGAAKGGGDYTMDDLKAYQRQSGKEPRSLFANPMLTPRYSLNSNSPAIDAGIDAGYPYGGAAPDMGAFEYDGGREHD